MFESADRVPDGFGPLLGRLRSTPRLSVVVLVAIVTQLLPACGDEHDDVGPAAVPPIETVMEEQITVNIQPHSASSCSATFARHELAHITSPRGPVEAMTDGTGTGVYLDDLDGDGRVDIVLPNLSGDTSVFWNTSSPGEDPAFARQVLATGRFRQAIAADLDGDGDRDLLLSTGIGPPVSFINEGDRVFRRQEFRTRAVTFSMAPGDLDGDGSVEILTGSYNAELTQNRDSRALTGVDVGVAVHRPTAGNLTQGVDHDYLTTSAQALAAMIVDLNGDGLDDVIVGNDLGTPDRLWLADVDVAGVAGLTATQVFDVTNLSTMSLDVADIDNDGDFDLLGTDMAPLADEPAELWAPVMSDIEQARVDDVQQPRNVVQFSDGSGTRFDERAVDIGVDATGWSWSGIVGDLDDDGFVDIYVVNGMQASGIFEDLAGGELVEANQVFRQLADGSFTQPEWGIDSTDGGRGMAQADIDGDGDLDIVINNLGTSAVLWENQTCDGSEANRSIIVEPIWSSAQNIDALGTVVTVDDGEVARARAITGARGYLSTGATQAHVGLGPDTGSTVEVEIRWPDGGVTTLPDVPVDTTIRVDRSSAAFESAGSR